MTKINFLAKKKKNLNKRALFLHVLAHSYHQGMRKYKLQLLDIAILVIFMFLFILFKKDQSTLIDMNTRVHH